MQIVILQNIEKWKKSRDSQFEFYNVSFKSSIWGAKDSGEEMKEQDREIDSCRDDLVLKIIILNN